MEHHGKRDFECMVIEGLADLVNAVSRIARALEHIAKGVPSQRTPYRMVVRFGVPEKEKNENG